MTSTPDPFRLTREDGSETLLGLVYRELLAAGDRLDREELRVKVDLFYAEHTSRGLDNRYRRLRGHLRRLDDEGVIRRCGDHVHVVQRRELTRRMAAGSGAPTLPVAFTAYQCAHCGRACRTYGGGYSSAPIGEDGYYAPTGPPGAKQVTLCHPNEKDRPDCYNEVTVKKRPLGELLGQAAPPSNSCCP